MENLISVIVPIYKVEPFLVECVESIINQTYKNLEIILIDDESPDKCGEICDEYAIKDSRIKVIHKKNGGISDARNAGLDIMQGDYIAFVDGDDWLPLDGIEILYKTLTESEADLAIGAYELVDEKGKLLEKNEKKIGVWSVEEAIEDVLEVGCRSWARLYRQEIHKEKKFPLGETHEDEAVVIEILDRCNKIAVTNECVYYYRYRSESILTSGFSKSKLDWKKQCGKNYYYIKSRYPDLQDKAAERYRDSLLWSLAAIATCENSKIYEKDAKEMMKELNDNKKYFLSLPFRYDRYYIRLITLCGLGFDVYRFLLKGIRSIKNNMRQ